MRVTTILQQIAAGNAGAVARCLEEYGGLVWTIATRYLGSERAEVEDAVQEVFVTLWRTAGQFDPAKGSEAAFVATVARRRIIDARRRAVARDPRRFAGRAREVEEAGRELRENAALGEEFARLPEDERLALWLVVSRGLSHREVAEATAAPVGTVKTRLRRALMRLRQALGGGSEGEVREEGRP